MLKIPVFTGSSVAIVTPFNDAGVDYDAFGRIIDEQIAGGTDAITVCGTTGESSTQSLEEHIAVVDFAVKHVNYRVPVIAGAGSNDTDAALMLSLEAEKSGADGLLLVTPYYNKATQRGLIEHFTYIADRVKTPIILYNVPSRTGMSFTAATYKTLSAHPNINGVKEASSNFSLIAQTVAACGEELNIWSGNDNETVAMMALGARGIISVAANVIPEAMARIADSCLEGAFKRATAMQSMYLELMDALFIEVNPIPVKTAMNLMGKDVGKLRLPLCDMEPGNLEKLKTALKNLGLI
ncbi:MAG: 4-hydroxy-tetrahydrodipicolinate synthase [Oscillospiraceae bacterium]|jgi:4-hydroxy-tetrahydrodipicolinate synthase|nr:4-hydroxy-tetrahydrodipicolinate synthase [Oscillospiraceae bacterium]